MLQQNGISQEEQKQHPQAVMDVVNFYKDNAEKSEDDAIWDKMGPAQPQGYAYQANIAPNNNYGSVQPLQSPPQSPRFPRNDQSSFENPRAPPPIPRSVTSPTPMSPPPSMSPPWYLAVQRPGLPCPLRPRSLQSQPDPRPRPRAPSSRNSKRLAMRTSILRSPTPLQPLRKAQAPRRHPVAEQTPREGHPHASTRRLALAPSPPRNSINSSSSRPWPWQLLYSNQKPP